MKKIISFITALLLAALPAAALDGEYYSESVTLAPGLGYTSVHAESEAGKRQRAYYFEYKPGDETVMPIAAYGTYMYGAETLTGIVAATEKTGYTVLGGINGDFFSMQTGIPMSVAINNGIFVSSCDMRNALGIKADGSCIIGSPSFSIKLTRSDGAEAQIDHLNKYPTKYASYVLTEDFYKTALNDETGVQYIVSISYGSFLTNGSLGGTLIGISSGTADIAIPSGCVVIAVGDIDPERADFEKFKIGDKVLIEVSSSDEWKNVMFAVGCDDVILKDGKVASDIENEAHEKVSNPRTAIGVTADGRYIFYALDGRQKDVGMGMSLGDLALELQKMGCVTAVNLDGGGSTTVAVRTGRDGVTVVNSPSDGVQRRISNAVLFVNSLVPTGKPAYLSVLPKTAYVLSGGGRVTLTAGLLDSSYYPIDGKDFDVTYSIAKGPGKISKNVFTASSVGETVISATASVDGVAVSGTARLVTVKGADSITVTAPFDAIPCGYRMPLGISAITKTYSPYAAAMNINWSGEGVRDGTDGNTVVTTPAGRLDMSGTFCADNGAYGKTASLVASYNGTSQYININVGIAPSVLCDFESGSAFTGGSITGGGWRSGNALAFSGTELTLTEPYQTGAFADSISLWINGGDGQYYAVIKTEDEVKKIPYETVYSYKFGGWKKLSAVLPAGCVITSPFASDTAAELRLDMITVRNTDAPPVFSDTASHWADGFITDAYNMELIDGSKTGDTLVFEPQRNLSRAEFAKLAVRLTGLDVSAYSETELTFADIADIPDWAVPYIKAVVGSSLMRGSGNPDGSVSFLAGNNISRQEVMYVFGGMLDTAPAELSFADKAAVADWAYTNIGKTVAAGIVRGYEDGTIKPNAPVSRAEASVMFVKMAEYKYQQN